MAVLAVLKVLSVGWEVLKELAVFAAVLKVLAVLRYYRYDHFIVGFY